MEIKYRLFKQWQIKSYSLSKAWMWREKNGKVKNLHYIWLQFDEIKDTIPVLLAETCEMELYASELYRE